MASMNKEPERDLELAAALRRLEGGSLLTEVEQIRIRDAIRIGAREALARRRLAPRTPFEAIAGWWKAAVPVAAAAALMLALVQPWHGRPAVEQASARSSLALVVAGEADEHDAVRAIVGPSEDVWASEAGGNGP
jgi:hypothetical protein